jgi:hypothetical protein
MPLLAILGGIGAEKLAKDPSVEGVQKLRLGQTRAEGMLFLDFALAGPQA